MLKHNLLILNLLVMVVIASCVDTYVSEDKADITPKINNISEKETIQENKYQLNKTERIEMNITEEKNLTITKNEAEETQNATKNTSAPKDQFAERCKDTDTTEEFPDGLNYKTKGEVTIDGIAIKNGVDYCNNIKLLAEWYCVNGIPQVNVYECPANCNNGVCG